MIETFRDRATEALFYNHYVARFSGIERVARRRLRYLAQARTLEDLQTPPGNRLEALKGDRSGQYGIRINRQWRICFRWDAGKAFDVEIVDYH